jgi:formylglycine-generating enzyme required for sulfatase activity
MKSSSKEDLATRRIEVFERLYGTIALHLAYHAAFPLTLTSDLLYCLRENFVPNCPWYVVADVLLSSLCQPVGYDLYEIEAKTRDCLLRDLCDEFGEKRLKELADFMSQYINSRLNNSLQSNDNNRALVLGHRPDWTALAYLKDDESDQRELINIIKQELLKLATSPDGKDRIRWGVLVESYADLLSKKGFKNWLSDLAEKIFNGEPILDDGKPILDDEEKSIEKLMGISLELFEYEFALINPDGEPEEKLKAFEFETVTVDNRGETINTEQNQAFYYVEYLGGKAGEPAELKLEMVAIPGGIFEMGSPEDEPQRRDNESPQHTVTVPPFFMSKYLVTQAQWRKIAALPQINRELKPEPSEFKGDDLPVEKVNWYDAVEFCDRLSKFTGRTYSLPTEAEWEYACRAGTTTPQRGSSVAPGGNPHDRADSPFHFGETITSDLANYDASSTYANEAKGEYREKTTPVGQFPPNAFGLYDMHGNVWEWCLDDYHDNYEGAPTDGSAWFDEENDNLSQKQGKAVLRGGSWGVNPHFCRSAFRYDYINDSRDDNYSLIGFRVVCAVGRGLK